MPDSQHRRPLNLRQLLVFLTIGFVSLLFWHTPFLYPIKIFVVFIHEAGHAFTTLLTGGQVVSMVVTPWQSGYVQHVGGNPLFIAAAGYIGSALFGGLLLLITDVHDRPTPQEPICFDWDVVEHFAPEFAIQSFRCFEKLGNGAYQSAEQSIYFDHANTQRRYGVLSARFMRIADPQPDPPAQPAASEPEPEAPEARAPSEPTLSEAATQFATAAVRTIRANAEQIVERARRDRHR